MSVGNSTVIPAALDWMDAGRRVAMATVIETWGSSPQPVGSKLLVDADGNFQGSVSGGCVEAAVVAEAAGVIARGKPAIASYGVEDEAAWTVGLACGGTIRVLIEPLGPQAGLYRSLQSEVDSRRPVVVLTELCSGAKKLVHDAAEAGPDLAPAVTEAFRTGKSRLLVTPDGEQFVDVFNPPLKLIVVGAVHIAQGLVPLAEALGFDITVVDPRESFAAPARFGQAAICRDWPQDALAKLGVDGSTALIALAHDPKLDDPALIEALRSGALYVGALGSKRTHAKRLERLSAAGVPEEALARIHAPIGLDLGAEGPAEIALAIIAEIVAVKRCGGGRR